MSLADWITGKAGSVATVATVAVAKPQAPTSIDAESPAAHRLNPQIIRKNVFATATGATPATHRTTSLPPELIEAASRVCVEIHDDPPEAVARMLADLAEYPPDRWPWLVDHFRSQLPDMPTDPAPAVVIATCGECRHGTATEHHAAILTCGLGISSGLPVGGRWHDDRHHCPEFTDRQTGRKPAPITATRDKTPPETRDFYNPFD